MHHVDVWLWDKAPEVLNLESQFVQRIPCGVRWISKRIDGPAIPCVNQQFDHIIYSEVSIWWQKERFERVKGNFKCTVCECGRWMEETDIYPHWCVVPCALCRVFVLSQVSVKVNLHCYTMHVKNHLLLLKRRLPKESLSFFLSLLFILTPRLPHLFHHFHWDQTKESLCRSLGSDQRRRKGIYVLSPFSLKQPSTICLFSHLSCYLKETSQNISFWLGLSPVDTSISQASCCSCGKASSTSLLNTDLAVAPLSLAPLGILAL